MTKPEGGGREEEEADDDDRVEQDVVTVVENQQNFRCVPSAKVTPIPEKLLHKRIKLTQTI